MDVSEHLDRRKLVCIWCLDWNSLKNRCDPRPRSRFYKDRCNLEPWSRFYKDRCISGSDRGYFTQIDVFSGLDREYLTEIGANLTSHDRGFTKIDETPNHDRGLTKIDVSQITNEVISHRSMYSQASIENILQRSVRT